MTMDAYVFSNRKVKSIKEWQKSIDNIGFKIKINSERDLERNSGHLPAEWETREAGFECGPGDIADLMETYNDIDFGGPWLHVYSFHWGTLPACTGAVMAAAAYAHATDGLFFDPQDSLLLQSSAAIQYARETELSFPKIEARMAELRRKYGQ